MTKLYIWKGGLSRLLIKRIAVMVNRAGEVILNAKAPCVTRRGCNRERPENVSFQIRRGEFISFRGAGALVPGKSHTSEYSRRYGPPNLPERCGTVIRM